MQQPHGAFATMRSAAPESVVISGGRAAGRAGATGIAHRGVWNRITRSVPKAASGLRLTLIFDPCQPIEKTRQTPTRRIYR
jgi:hypothetical protein